MRASTKDSFIRLMKRSKQFVDIRGVFYEAWCRKKEEQERHRFSELKLLLY